MSLIALRNYRNHIPLPGLPARDSPVSSGPSDNSLDPHICFQGIFSLAGKKKDAGRYFY
jgi:hypothetical protein